MQVRPFVWRCRRCPLPAEVGSIQLRPTQKCRTRASPSSVRERATQWFSEDEGVRGRFGRSFAQRPPHPALCVGAPSCPLPQRGPPPTRGEGAYARVSLGNSTNETALGKSRHEHVETCHYR